MRLYEIQKTNLRVRSIAGHDYVLTPEDQSMVARIAAECSDYVRVGATLYHGTADSSDYIVRHPHQKDMDDGYEFAGRIDELLAEAGFRARRSNSLYTVGIAQYAAIWAMGGGGHVYAVYPTDGYAVTWHDRVRDLGGEADNHLPDRLLAQVQNERQGADLFWKLFGNGFRQGDAAAAARSGNEAYLNAPTVYGISIDKPNWRGVEREIRAQVSGRWKQDRREPTDHPASFAYR